MKNKGLNLFILLSLLSIQLGFSKEKKPVVAATASIIWDMAKNIGGDHFDTRVIVPIGGDPHIYEPTPSDARLVASADLILKNGLTFEGWINTLIANSGTNAEVITVTKGVPAISSMAYKDATDPHAWMDASYGQYYLSNIKDALIQLAPEHQADIEANYKAYSKKLADLDIYIQKEINKIPEKQRILITSHDAFQYYGRKYGLKLQAIQGVSTDAEVQTSDILRVNKVIRESGVPAVFVETTINPKMLNRLAKDNNITVGGHLFSDSIGDEKSDAPSYLSMLKHNTDVIVKALTSQPNTNKDQTTSNASSSENNTSYWMIGLLAIVLVGGMLFMINKLNRG